MQSKLLRTCVLFFSALFLGLFGSLQAEAKPRFMNGAQVEVVRESPAGFELLVTIPKPNQAPRVLEDGQTYLELSLPGAQTMLEAGEPGLPLVGIPFAFPLGSKPQLEIQVLETSSFEGPQPLPAVTPKIVQAEGMVIPTGEFKATGSAYGRSSWYPASVGSLGEEAGFRNNRMQTVVLTPVQSRGSQYQVANKIRVKVTFASSSKPHGLALVPAGPASPQAEAASRALFVNANSAQSFAMRERPRDLAVLGSAQTGNAVRVRVGGVGIARIPFSDLAAAGFPVNQPLDNIRIEERDFNAALPNPYIHTSLPRWVEDTNENSVFDDGDFVAFYAENFEERFDPVYRDSRFSYFHTYWVMASSEGGKRFEVVPAVDAGAASFTSVTSTTQKLHMEEENYYINWPPDDIGQFEPVRPTTYWLGPFAQDANETFNVDLPHADPNGFMNFRAAWQGAFLTGPSRIHRVSVVFNDTRVADSETFSGTATKVWQSEPIPTNTLVTSTRNEITIEGRGESDLINGSGAYFDFIEIEYDRLLAAEGDQLRFTTGTQQGDLELVVSNFTTDDLVILDVTDPTNPIQMSPEIQTDGAGFSATLRLLGVTGEREFLAAVPSQQVGLPSRPQSSIQTADYPLPRDLEFGGLIGAGSSRDLLAEGNGSDYILITHPEFKEAWQPLVDLRESRGHRVLLCDVFEVYDQFSGGNKTPRAIERFLKEAFRQWDEPPLYLCLGGDSNEDYRSEISSSKPDWVPTMMHLASVPGGLQLRELAGTDTWFASAAAPGDSNLDPVPDMFVGRLPAGSVSDVNLLVDKIVNYETVDPSAEWRNRGVFLADDAYSTSITGTQFYCWKSVELSFTQTVKDICETHIPMTGNHTDFNCIPFLMSELLDDVPELRRDPGPGDCPRTDNGQTFLTNTAEYVRENLTPDLLSLLGQGHLFWSYTGHANKHQMATESLVRHRQGFSGLDLDGINNFGKPFIFHGFACHLNEYEHAREGIDGRGIGEVLVMQENRGAIGSVASTGYEWAHLNESAQLAITSPFFWDQPRDPVTNRPIRLLSHATYTGLIKFAASTGFNASASALMRTYLVLGDPALVIDFGTPRLEVRVNDEPIDDSFTLTAPDLNTAIPVTLSLSEDTDLESLRVFDGETELPEESIELTLLNADSPGARSYTASFETKVRLETYDIRVQATDWAGGVTESVIPVRFNSTFFAVSESGAGGEERRQLEPGEQEFLGQDEPVEIELSSPVPLSMDSFEVSIDGNALTGAQISAADEDGYAWTIRTTESWGVGDHLLTVKTSREGQSKEVAIDFRVANAAGLAGTPYFYPNPSATTEGALFFELSDRPEKCMVKIYTVRGRKVREDQLFCNPGTNAYRWDLTDQVGDRVANGIYLLVLDIEAEGSAKVRHMEKVAVTR
ncbi:MAG: hypothetical protein HKN21_11795 [Candidatus Eisenbacteria bacterium]|uniref:Gingipain domain-containing protein n=1 Tax=Eiseniibacteriota bacterium TaxID=2212470 RepID=A0A7Y2E915_UNCEI|nr:hypothetical protein [Candidatus Eisenbacteria bacterium]